MKFKKYIEELKRRNVFKSAIAYLIMAWIIIQISATVLNGFGAPEYIFRIIAFIVFIGFPIWLVFAWVYEITPEGIRKTDNIGKKPPAPPHTQNRLNKVIIVSLSIVIILLLFNESGNPLSNKKEGSKINNRINKSEKSIAVLPFLNLSKNGNKEFLADGITEAINLELSKKDSLRVISRTSSMSYKNENRLLSDIAKELKVDYILEGSVLFDYDSIRVTVQLIAPFPKETHVWYHTYNEKYENIFQLVEKVSAEIANEINIAVLPGKKESNNYKVNSKAYDFYLRGRYLMNLETEKSVKNSIEYFNESIKLDSGYASAYAALAEAYITLNKFNSDYHKKQKNAKKSRTAIDKAIILDNTLGAAFITKGNILGKCDWEWNEMKKMAEKGLKLEPNNSNGHVLLSDYYSIKNNFKKAIDEALLAEKLDPINPKIGSLLAERYFMANDYEKAIDQYEKVLELFPNYGFAWEGLGYAQYITGQNEEALNSWKRFQEIMGNESMAINFTFAGTAEQSFRLWLSKAKTKPLAYASNPTVLAQLHMLLGEKKEALDYLDFAYKNHDENLPITLLRPHFTPLHNNPRFRDLAQNTGVTIK